MWPLFAVLLSLLAVTMANTETYHNLSRNTQACSDCHTLHYSEKGTTPAKSPFGKSGFVEAGGPFAKLLMQSTTNGLCLFCHDGSVPQAPDVRTDSNYTIANSGDEHSGAGFFGSVGSANNKGHDLAVSASTVPFSSKTNVTLTCASCHDPHGTPNYRNILTAPAGGEGVSVIMEKDVYRNVSPGDTPTETATRAAYKRSNLGYKLYTSKWCTECHEQLQSHINPANQTRTKNHHLVDVEIDDFGSNTDSTNWYNGDTNWGFGTATGDTIAGVPRLRFQVVSSSSVTNWDTANDVATSNEVMCMTCHLAHGGKYLKGLVWPKKDNLSSPYDVDTNSGCNQCHKGGQQ